MTARLSPLAGRFDHVHGDEDLLEVSPADEREIELRTAELIAERLADPGQFEDLMTGIEPTLIYPHLQRAILNVMRPGLGRVEVDAITTAVHLMARIVKAEAESVWKEECEALAEGEILE